MTDPDTPWDAWFPDELDPIVADQIGELWWNRSPHYAAYLAWTAYAATLPAKAPVSSVGTGVQTVAFTPAAAPGELGAAMARAQWHLDQSGYGDALSSTLLQVDTPLSSWRVPPCVLIVDEVGSTP